MLKDIVRGGYVEETNYQLVFMYGETWGDGGFSFDCNEDGSVNPDELEEPARKNLDWCLKNPDRFAKYNKVTSNKRLYRKPDIGTCHCGAVVILENQHMGACQCPRCKQWYNMAGQELLPPEQWGWDGTPIEEE